MLVALGIPCGIKIGTTFQTLREEAESGAPSHPHKIIPPGARLGSGRRRRRGPGPPVRGQGRDGDAGARQQLTSIHSSGADAEAQDVEEDEGHNGYPVYSDEDDLP